MNPLLLLPLALAAPDGAGPSRIEPRADLPSLFSNDDYPAAALEAEEEGTVAVRLDVDAKGRLARCTVTESSGSAALDATTCRVFEERARFRPARDAAGKPVPDTVATRITWRIDQEASVPAALDAAMLAWLDCLKPTFAARLVDPARSVRSAGEEAFPTCRAAEDRMLTAAAEAGETDPSEEARTRLREQVIALVEEARSRTPN